MEMPTTWGELRAKIEDATEVIAAAEKRLKKAEDLLREWRDKYGGKEVHRFTNYGGNYTSTASPTDLLRDTNRWLERK